MTIPHRTIGSLLRASALVKAAKSGLAMFADHEQLAEKNIEFELH